MKKKHAIKNGNDKNHCPITKKKKKTAAATTAREIKKNTGSLIDRHL